MAIVETISLKDELSFVLILEVNTLVSEERAANAGASLVLIFELSALVSDEATEKEGVSFVLICELRALVSDDRAAKVGVSLVLILDDNALVSEERTVKEGVSFVPMFDDPDMEPRAVSDTGLRRFPRPAAVTEPAAASVKELPRLPDAETPVPLKAPTESCAFAEMLVLFAADDTVE